jgi:hypothetical protein
MGRFSIFGTPGRARTDTGALLGGSPLPLGYGGAEIVPHLALFIQTFRRIGQGTIISYQVDISHAHNCAVACAIQPLLLDARHLVAGQHRDAAHRYAAHRGPARRRTGYVCSPSDRRAYLAATAGANRGAVTATKRHLVSRPPASGIPAMTSRP